MLLNKKLKYNKLTQLKTYNLLKFKYKNSIFNEYLIGSRKNYDIINLEKILIQWYKIKKLIENILLKNKKILVIHTNNRFKKVLKFLSNQSKQFYYNCWSGGLVTNYYHTRWVFKKTNTFFLNEKPGLIILFDCHSGLNILNEAKIKNIPVIHFLSKPILGINSDYPILGSVTNTALIYFYLNLFLQIFRDCKIFKRKKLNIFRKHQLKQETKKKKIWKKKKIIKLRRKNWFKKNKINLLKKKIKNQNISPLEQLLMFQKNNKTWLKQSHKKTYNATNK